MSAAQGLLATGLVAALLALNALFPVRRCALLVGPSFFAAWLPLEASLHVAALLVVGTAGWVAFGGLAEAAGWAGLLLCLAALGVLGFLWRQGWAAAAEVEAELVELFGDDYRERLRRAGVDLNRPLPRGRLLLPLWFSDPAVELLRDIAYRPDGLRRHRLDIYRPRVRADGAARRAPVLLQVHGGGWTIGHKAQQGRPLMNTLAATGWVCVAINYRRSPWHRWPAQLDDVNAALDWVRAHIVEYGGDPSFIVVTGGSAGAHLAAMAALTAGKASPFGDGRPSVQGLVSCYGVYDLLDRERQWCYRGLRWFLRAVVMPRRASNLGDVLEQASPLSWVAADAPPCLVINGRNDSLVCRDEPRLFVRELRRASRQPVGHIELPYAQHAFDLFWSPRTLAAVHGILCFASMLYLQHRERDRG